MKPAAEQVEKGMRGKPLSIALVSTLTPGLTAAIEYVDFDLLKTEDLLRVCSVVPNDPLTKEAIHCCIVYIEAAADAGAGVLGRWLYDQHQKGNVD